MNYWAIDPGPTPGMACVREDLHEFQTWTCDDVGTCLYVMWDVCADGSVAGVFMEDFVLAGGGRPKTPAGSKTTMEVIGAIKFICEFHEVRLRMQAPGDAAAFSTNDKLRAMGWKTPSSPDHERSAARHLLMGLTRIGTIEPLSLLGKMWETK